jgi:hypothetical protein
VKVVSAEKDRHERKAFEGQTIRVDGQQFEGCTFTGCKILYGGGYVRLINNNFTDCEWEFDGSASRTLEFLMGVYQMSDETLKFHFRAMLEHIMPGQTYH